MGAPQYEQAGADIGGTGTTNTIPRWTGPSTLGDSGLIDNGTAIYTTARRWGVGTAVPAVTAQVAATATYSSDTAIGFRVSDATTIAKVLDFGFDAAIGKGFIQSAWRGVSWNDTLINPNGGNVGIGTASPQALLHVGSTSAFPQIKVSDTGQNTGLIVFGDGLSTQRNVGIWRASPNSVSVGGNSLNIGSYEAIVFTTGAAQIGSQTERARIDSNGNIYGTSGTTGMTNGFFYIPAAAGAPTGVPTAVAGRVPMYYDTTNNQFYVYNGAWKKVTLA